MSPPVESGRCPAFAETFTLSVTAVHMLTRPAQPRHHLCDDALLVNGQLHLLGLAAAAEEDDDMPNHPLLEAGAHEPLYLCNDSGVHGLTPTGVHAPGT